MARWLTLSARPPTTLPGLPARLSAGVPEPVPPGLIPAYDNVGVGGTLVLGIVPGPPSGLP